MAYALLPRIDELAEKLLRIPSETPHHLQVQGDLEALQRMVRRIHAVLNDAENMEIHEESVRLWLRELKGVAYDADDVLDEYHYELLRAEVAARIQADDAAYDLRYQQTHKDEGRLEKIWRRWFPRTVHHGHTVEASKSASASVSSDATIWSEIADKIGKIRGRFEEISKQRDALHLREGDGERQSRNTGDRLPSSPDLVDDPKIYGRGEDVEKVVNRLLYSEECKKNNLSVLPIVGMGGVGKTTLVQHVYNDQRICGHFPVKGWVCVSNDFEVEKLTARIIESVTKRECHLKEFSVLQEKLKNLLDGKRFLLVLDDVWNEKQSLWESLQQPLRFGAQGSAVVTTTRNESVAKIMQTTPFHPLDCLSVDDCWEVFIKSAFVDRDPEHCPGLVETGKKIVRKCGGLPLAAKSLGGLLSYETDVNVWKEVLQSNIWDLGGQGDGIIPALRLSYLHLPSYLKQCFLYASAFPKDFVFRKNHIVQLWMAQGFVQCKGSKQAEDVGEMYFKELVQRSSFQYYPGLHVNKEDPCFVIHDLIHDLAQHISGQEFFQMEGDGHAHVPYLNTVRHLSVVNQKLETLEKTLLSAPWAIRTLLIKAPLGDLKFPGQMLLLLQSLRALDLRFLRLNELPDPIGNLKHLRYLNLDYTGIASLPDSICKLYNLQTLSMLYCRSLTRLPRDFKNLINLRCLKIEGTSTEFLPRGFGKLTSLRALDEFRVGFRRNPISHEDLHGSTVEQLNCLSLQPSNEECGGIEELKDLVYLRDRLEISNLQWVMNIANDAAVADLRNKQNIRELLLSWKREKPASSHVQMQVLESLQPPNNLEVLRIDGYGGPRLPSWMAGDPSPLSKLVRLAIDMCRRCTYIPPLGQLPSLKHLEFKNMGKVMALGPEFCGQASVGFPVLEELAFCYMGKWVTWELAALSGAFPCLRLLSVRDCPELESMVPLYLLPALEVLHIWDCPRLRSIELWGGPPSTGPPPLRKMTVVDCQLARFSTMDDEHLLLPPTLGDLSILGCPMLLDWCGGGGGSRFAHIAKARFWTIRNGKKLLSTSVPKVANGELVLRFSGNRSSHSEVRLRPEDNYEEDLSGQSKSTSRSNYAPLFHHST